MPTTKICLLVTEDSIDYGGDTGVADMIIEKLKNVSDPNKVLFHRSYVTRNEFPESTSCYNGYIITGSHHSANTKLPWIEHLKTFITNIRNCPTKPKLFSICFGHQVTAIAFGGDVKPNKCGKLIWYWGDINISDELSNCDYFVRIFGKNVNTIEMMESHNDEVVVMPELGKRVGWSNQCENEIIIYGDNILTMQGHPELSLDRMLNHFLPFLKTNQLLTPEMEKHALRTFEKCSAEKSENLLKFIIAFLCK